MNKELILQMQGQFDSLAQTHPEATGLEFWFARDLQDCGIWKKSINPLSILGPSMIM
jgi:hypothetical protein